MRQIRIWENNRERRIHPDRLNSNFRKAAGQVCCHYSRGICTHRSRSEDKQ